MCYDHVLEVYLKYSVSDCVLELYFLALLDLQCYGVLELCVTFGPSVFKHCHPHQNRLFL